MYQYIQKESNIVTAEMKITVITQLIKVVAVAIVVVAVLRQ